MKPTILIVDDEPELLNILSCVLRREFHVLTASNGEDALCTLKTHPSISLILLDLDMPVMNGLEMLKRIRIKGNDIKVMIMSGTCCYEWARECADLNVQGYIEKGFNPEKLICKIKKILGIEEFRPLRELWGDDYGERISSISHTVKGALKFIHQNYQKHFTRAEIAKLLNITPGYLSDKFHKECGMQLRDYINIHRIYKSKEYLAEPGNIMIKEVAFSVGIPDSSHFSKLFKKHTGLLPGEFRKNS